MTKAPIPLRVDDMTHFARSLAKQLGETSPSHLTLMNMVARAAGFQNVQHMRSVSAAAKRLERPADDPLADARSVERAMHQFDRFGRLTRWPSKRSVQSLALWALWAALPANTSLGEEKVNEIFGREHCFGDPATLRRTMIACGLMSRKKDGTNYRRVEQKPPIDARTVIRNLSLRRRARVEESTGAENA